MVLHSWSLPPYSSPTPFLSTEDLALSSTVNPAFKASATQSNRPTSKLDNTNKNPINKKFLVQNKLLFCLVPTRTKNHKKRLCLIVYLSTVHPTHHWYPKFSPNFQANYNVKVFLYPMEQNRQHILILCAIN